MKSGIYKITNIITGLFYIGSANNIERRFIEHRKNLRGNKHSNSYLQNAWNKYWEHLFKFEIIEFVMVELLIEREQYWFDLTKCYDRSIGYNLRPKAASNKGCKFSEEFKEMRRKNQTGKKASEETRAKMAASHKRRKRPDNIGKLISAAKKGKGVGKKLSEETKANMKLAQYKRRWENFVVNDVIEYHPK